MNLLHISDAHFGPRHWEGNDQLLLDKLNAYQADIVINTGDSTSDGLESEFEEAEQFFNSIDCEHVISIMGNHDKRNMRSQELHKKHIYHPENIYPSIPENCTKKNLYLDRRITKINENYTDINFVTTISINQESILIVSLDSNEIYKDIGFVDEEVLRTVSNKLDQLTYDKALLMIHHSILGVDEDPLQNSMRLIDFVVKHKIEHVFCGHTHELDLRQSFDLYSKHSFTQYMNGSLCSCNHSHDSNMFLFFENWGDDDMKIQLVRIFPEGDRISFKEETILGDRIPRIRSILPNQGRGSDRA